MTLNISEVFTTIQGEGPNIGKLTYFVRFGLCNLRCPGWGETILPSGEKVGCCDTPYAVFPEYRDQWEKLSWPQLVAIIEESEVRHVCLTGGEPLLQQSGDLSHLVEHLISRNVTIDLFTNGTRKLPLWAVAGIGVTTCMDYKPPSSGEYGKFDKCNWDLLSSKDMLKLVIDPHSSEDWRVVYDVLERTQGMYNPPQVYVGVIWGANLQVVADRIVTDRLPVRLGIQTHKWIWGQNQDGESLRENQVTLKERV